MGKRIIETQISKTMSITLLSINEIDSYWTASILLTIERGEEYGCNLKHIVRKLQDKSKEI